IWRPTDVRFPADPGTGGLLRTRPPYQPLPSVLPALDFALDDDEFDASVLPAFESAAFDGLAICDSSHSETNRSVRPVLAKPTPPSCRRPPTHDSAARLLTGQALTLRAATRSTASPNRRAPSPSRSGDSNENARRNSRSPS